MLCDACVTRFAQPVPRCSTCALPVPPGVAQCGTCLPTPPPLDACVAAVDYAWPWTDCVAQFKFGGQPGWAGALATLMRSTPWVEPALEQRRLVLPMPLSRERLAERGFNQALLLARQLAAQNRQPACCCVPVTPAQTDTARAERLRNVRGAFAVEPLRAMKCAASEWCWWTT